MSTGVTASLLSTSSYNVHPHLHEHPDPYREANLDKDAPLKVKVHDLFKFIDSQKFGMMTTRQADTGFLVSRCMSVAAKDGMDLLFHTNTESGKTGELEHDPHVNVAFLDSSNRNWASISGTAKIVQDRDYVKKYYSPNIKAWVGNLGDGVHDGSENDPRVGIIKVHIRSATYSFQTGNVASRVYEVAKGSVTGKAANVNTLRELSESEWDTYRKSLELVS